MKPAAGMVWMGCLVWSVACAQSGERSSARAPSSAQAEEAPARPIATSLASDPLEEAPAASSKEQGATYTCPMHPEVQQSGPGECPKCGMKLVPMQKPSPQAEPAHEHAH